MTITGVHAVIYTRDEVADRAFFRDILGLPWIDAGQGRLMFAAPPTDIAFHAAEQNDEHEVYLICDDIAAEVADLKARDVTCGPIEDRGWGLLTSIRLPGGGSLGLYEARHARPHGA